MYRHILTVVCATYLGGIISAWAAPVPSLDYTAATDPDGGTDSSWEDTAGPTGLDFTLGAGVTYDGSPADAPANVSAVYTYDGSSSATGSGFDIRSVPGNPVDGDASFEILFRPTDNFGKHVLWETGDTAGSSMLLNGNLLEFVAVSGSSAVVSTVNPGGIATSPGQYVHAVVVIDLANDQLNLYVNGALVDGPTGYTPGSWAGGDDTGLGSKAGNGVGGIAGVSNPDGYGNFKGDIALFRMYESALGPSDVSDLFNAVGVFPAPKGPINLLSTTFSGRTVTNATAGNIPWIANGIDAPGDLTAVERDGDGIAELTGLFDTAAAGDHFAPDLNVGNEGPWSVDIAINPSGRDVKVLAVQLDWDRFSNTGGSGGGTGAFAWTVTLSGSTSGLVATQTNAVTAESGVETVTFDSAVTLTTAETWTLQLLAETRSNDGFNIGLDGINIVGNILAPPTGAVLYIR